jgi:hypothetical protein
MQYIEEYRTNKTWRDSPEIVYGFVMLAQNCILYEYYNNHFHNAVKHNFHYANWLLDAAFKLFYRLYRPDFFN